MSMLQTTLDYVRRCTADEMRSLAEQSGVPIHTIIKLRNGQTTNPRIGTLEPLHTAIARAVDHRRRDSRHPLRRATDQVLTPTQVRSEVAEGDA
jgi:transcriptional regulator with XRE-family HTH domain